jgi:hypothetical protein
MQAANQVPVLTFVNGDRAGEVFPLPPSDGIIVGRSSEADLVLKDDNVSRKHARLFGVNGSVWLRDLGSRNGTLVNGRAVVRSRLRTGDRIAVAGTLFKLSWVAAKELGRTMRQNDTGGRAMSGRLEDIPLADVLQWLAASRKSGVLSVQSDRLGLLFLSEGRVCGAEIEGAVMASPEKAILRMMQWPEGRFDLDANSQRKPKGEELSASLEHLLMESARLQDELAHLAETESLPAERVRLVYPSPRPWSELSPELIDTLQNLAWGEARHLSWEDYMSATPGDDVTIAKRTIALKKLGIVRFDDA